MAGPDSTESSNVIVADFGGNPTTVPPSSPSA